MKILSIGNFGFGWDGSICDEEHVASALESLGHEVTRVQRGEISLNNGDNNYDFTLLSQWDGYGDISWLPRPIVYWAFDYQRDGQLWHEDLISKSDLYLSKRISDSKYPNWQWLPQDFAPSFLEEAPEVEKDIDVLFTGSYIDYATERNDILTAVDDLYDLTIHSFTPDAFRAQGFKNVHGPVMDSQLPELIARAKVVLSLDAVNERGYWSDRNAQTMACGGFVLYRHAPMSESVFKDKIAYFYDKDDCLGQIKFWLTNDWARNDIAFNGRIFASMNLMVKNRVKDLITLVGGIL